MRRDIWKWKRGKETRKSRENRVQKRNTRIKKEE